MKFIEGNPVYKKRFKEGNLHCFLKRKIEEGWILNLKCDLEGEQLVFHVTAFNGKEPLLENYKEGKGKNIQEAIENTLSF